MNVILSRFDGPPCTQCGCRDVRVLSEPTTQETSKPEFPWIAPGRASCNHCGSVFSWHAEPEEPQSLRAEPPVLRQYYAGPTCPECDGDNVKCVKSPKAEQGSAKIRYHKCRDCGANFKTAETAPASLRTA